MRNKIEAGLQKLHYYTRIPEGQNDLGRETAKNVVRTLSVLFAIGFSYNAIRIAEGGMGIQRQDVQLRSEAPYLIHRVTPEDRNLFRIGLEYGMTPDYLACVNGINKNFIYVGQDLIIPLTAVPECNHLK